MKNKVETCKHHGLPVVRGRFCEKCEHDLQKTSDFLNAFFQRPKTIKAINDALSR